MQIKCDLVPEGMFKMILTKVNVGVTFWCVAEYVNTYTPTKKRTIQKNLLN